MAPAYDTIDPATLELPPSTPTSNPPPFPPGSRWGRSRPPGAPTWVGGPPPPPPASTSAPPPPPQTSPTSPPAVLSTTPSTITRTATSRPVVSSFPLLPLTTVFKPHGPECNRLTSVTSPTDYLNFATEGTCFPPGYTSGPEGFFFSPGVACPSGYRTACQDATRVASITTVTCCPTLKNMPDMSCYDGSGTPDTMPWFQCRAAVPATGLTLSVAGPDLDARGTYTALQTVTSPAVIYAYGVKMVYQATDLTTSSPGSATSSTGLPLPLSEPATSSTLPIGAIVALGVAIPLGVLGALVAAFLVWRGKKRQRESMAIAAPWEKSYELPTKSHEGMLGSSLYEMASEEMRSEMPGTGQPVELGG